MNCLKRPAHGQACVLSIAIALLSTPARADADLLTEEVIVSASRVEESIFITPYTVDTVSAQRIRMAGFRTVPDIFREIPGTLVQKTAHGQGSPYIRGFTGFRNLFMIDGIRLNNAVFREGPNQYWATVDVGAIQRLEVVNGPKSVLYGSDAIGGTVNALSRGPVAYRNGQSLGGGLNYRYGDAEDSHILGGHADVALSDRGGLLVGGSTKNFGDLESGAGELPNTGYDEWTIDSKLVYDLSDNLTVSGAHSQVHQDNVPRTHKTIHSISYAGTDIGSEYSRNLDQDRMLNYIQLQAQEGLGWENWNVTLFHHQQEEERERLRSRDRFDSHEVKVDTFGLSLSASLSTERFGQFTAGADWAHDDVNSSSSRNPIQGPVADDSTYDWFGVFLQNRYDISDSLDLTTGLRFTYNEVDAGRISDPVDGSEFSYSDDWSEPVGNLRLGWSPVPDQWRVYTGVSQGFRAPNLSDLTRFDTARSNEFEIPSVNLDAERFLQYELGARFRSATLDLEAATYYTDISDQIQRLLTGNVNADGDNEITKANVGDGDLYGVELRGSWAFGEGWLAFGHFAWLDGEISTEAQVGAPSVDDNHSRTMPTNYRLGLRYESAGPRKWWLETEGIRVDKADKLSLRDKSDTQRMPPGGTPSYNLLHLRGGLDLTSQLQLNLALENLFDENYRVHGSGQNEPGLNAVVALYYSF